MYAIPKPTVKYRLPIGVHEIMQGFPACIIALDHPKAGSDLEHLASTSKVLKYDPITGAFETRNTLYELQVEVKSIPKTNHALTKDAIDDSPWEHRVPLTEKQVEAASNSVKHDLHDVFGTNFKYITCDKCDINKICKLAFDIYNTDGDCLLK